MIKLFYNEIYDFLLSIERNKPEIEKKQKLYPNMNYNQILSYFQIVYPDRISTKTKKDSIKCTAFRKICNNYKIKDQKRKSNKNDIDGWFKIPYENEKENILNKIHWNNNHCGRDAMIDFIKRDKWYWYGFYDDIMNYIKDCPSCDNAKSKFKKINTGIKIKGPHYRYIADLWYLSKEISLKCGYKYILDVIDHFSKWYQGYPLITKNAGEILTYIKLFIQNFGKPVLLQTDNGLEFCNSDLSNFCTNNDIKIIHGKPRHPQS